MKTLISKKMAVSLVLTTGAALTLFLGSEGWAQQKHKISFKCSAENTKYTQQHVIGVGDVPGHQVRIYEFHRTFPKDPPMYEGVRAAESWTRGYSNYTDVNGRGESYTIYSLENGDKIVTRDDIVSQTVLNPDGSNRSTATVAATITGGTGKFLGIRGTLRSTVIFDPKAGLNESQFEGEYWIEK